MGARTQIVETHLLSVLGEAGSHGLSEGALLSVASGDHSLLGASVDQLVGLGQLLSLESLGGQGFASCESEKTLRSLNFVEGVEKMD